MQLKEPANSMPGHLGIDAVIDHFIAFDLHEECSGWVLDEMFIKAEFSGGADDGEHCAMVSRRIDDMQFNPDHTFRQTSHLNIAQAVLRLDDK